MLKLSHGKPLNLPFSMCKSILKGEGIGEKSINNVTKSTIGYKGSKIKTKNRRMGKTLWRRKLLHKF